MCLPTPLPCCRHLQRRTLAKLPPAITFVSIVIIVAVIVAVSVATAAASFS
jgi:hypothetical protein